MERRHQGHVQGYFFTSADQSVLTQVKRNANETPAQYLARVKAKYGEPAATAETTFTGSGQTNTVTAKTATGDDWTVPADMGGYYGTWVWTFEKAGQPSDLQNRFTGDYVAEAGVASENAVVHTEAHAASQTANATIAPNGELATASPSPACRRTSASTSRPTPCPAWSRQHESHRRRVLDRPQGRSRLQPG